MPWSDIDTMVMLTFEVVSVIFRSSVMFSHWLGEFDTDPIICRTSFSNVADDTKMALRSLSHNSTLLSIE